MTAELRTIFHGMLITACKCHHSEDHRSVDITRSRGRAPRPDCTPSAMQARVFRLSIRSLRQVLCTSLLCQTLKACKNALYAGRTLACIATASHGPGVNPCSSKIQVLQPIRSIYTTSFPHMAHPRAPRARTLQCTLKPRHPGPAAPPQAAHAFFCNPCQPFTHSNVSARHAPAWGCSHCCSANCVQVCHSHDVATPLLASLLSQTGCPAGPAA